MPTINEQRFRESLEQRLGEFWNRALTVFTNYGPNLENDVIDVLDHAVKQEKVEEILVMLEKHYEGYLRFHKIEVRGTIASRLLGYNPTKVMFIQIRK